MPPKAGRRSQFLLLHLPLLTFLGSRHNTSVGDLATMSGPCPLCEDRGMRIVVEENGRQHAEPCSCRLQKRGAAVMARARIPMRYEHCDLESYAFDFSGANPSLRRAYMLVRRYLSEYPLGIDGTGLLFTGSIGVGKTHLAVGLLRELILTRGATGLFCDYRDLLKQVQNSYNPNVAQTELEVLGPVFDAEVLVLDEIGASKPSEWVWDTVAHILNTRYNNRKVTILTTNYANLPPGGTRYPDNASGQARAAMREETLGDRIGERMRSRLQEMCLPVEMGGQDFRQNIKRAFLD